MSRCPSILAVLSAAFSLFAASAAAAPAERFTLGKIVPEDSWLYMHWVPNPEREFLDKHWSHVLEDIAGLNLEQDLRQMIMPPGATADTEPDVAAAYDRAVKLVKSVEWSTLLSGEAVLFSRWPDIPEIQFVLKPKAESLDKHVSGLVAIFEELAKINPDVVKLTPSTHDDAKMWSLGPADAPIALRLYHRKDIVALAISTSPEATTSLLGEKGAGQPPLIESARFKKAVSGVQPAEDCVVYMDAARILATWQRLITQHAPPPPADPSAPPTDDQITSDIVQTVLKDIDFVDYFVMTSQTDGLKTTSSSLTQLQDNCDSKKLCKALVRSKPITGIEKYIPQEANSFTAMSGFDFEVLYDYIVDFMRRRLPGGQEHIAAWEKMQADYGFSVKADLLSWLEGQWAVINMPASMPSPFATQEMVIMLRVEDRDKALKTIETQLNRIGEGLMISAAADVSAPDFKSAVYAPFAMFGKLTYGVHQDWLIFTMGPSGAAVNKCVSTASGEGKGFKGTERAERMGLKFDQPLTSASYEDLRAFYQQLGQQLGGMQMAMMLIPQGPETQQLRPLFTMMAKLAPVVGKIDFMLESAQTCTMKDQGRKCTTVTTYKEYVLPTEREEGAKDKPSLDGL